MPNGKRWGKKAGRCNGRGEGGQEWTPTVKQLRYMRARMTFKDGKQMTVRQAAEAAGYSTTDTQLRRLTGNPHMQQWMREMMDEAGVSEADVIRVYVEALTATKITRSTYKGDTIEEYEDIDHATRIAAARALADLMGLQQKKNAGEDDTKHPGVLNIVVISERMDSWTDEQLEEALAREQLGLPDPEQTIMIGKEMKNA